MSVEERIVEVMGTTAHVVVTEGVAGLADRAVEHLEDLEARWSRFRPDSEISRLNERVGVPVLVSRSTYELVDHALEGRRLTAERFDPTLLDALCAAGYDRSFELLGTVDAPPSVAGRHQAPARVHVQDPEPIRLDPITGTVWLAPGVQFDPGGIGKGFAADVVVDFVLAEGARGALVNVGGDLRAEGMAPEGSGWVVAVTDPNHPDRIVSTVALEAGAVASTWRTKRTWTAPDGSPRHHLIDPSTGLPATTGLAGVTVLAGRGWQAEVLAKAAFLAGPSEGAGLLAADDAAGLLFADDGTVHEAGAWADFGACI